jgi:cytochrome c oxidase cbb3-type subunit 1
MTVGADWLAFVHALGWLVVVCFLGLLLATLLLVPTAGVVLGAWTYGRLAPLHLDLALYGWIALPAVAVLLRWFAVGVAAAGGDGIDGGGSVARVASAAAALGRLAVAAWSAALLLGAASWLGGETTGKLFLDWTGPARGLLLAALGLLWLALATWTGARILRRRLARGRRHPEGLPRDAAVDGAAGSGWSLVARLVVLAGLAAVPVALAWSGDPAVYPPVDPETGGPTGTSLLGSTVGLLVFLLGLPALLGLAPDRPRAVIRRATRALVACWLLYAAAFAVLALAAPGDHRHREPRELFAMAILLPWGLLLARWYAAWRWPRETAPWRRAGLGWGGLLLVSAVVMYLPGVLDAIKFGQVLVAHSHLAMAGFLSALHGLLLAAVAGQEVQANRGGAPGPWAALAAAIADPAASRLWNLGLAVQLVALAVLGLAETADPGLVLRGSTTSAVAYLVRWLGGLGMLAAAVRWVRLAGGGARAREVAGVGAVAPGAVGHAA